MLGANVTAAGEDPAEAEARRVLRRVFCRDDDSRMALAIILADLGTWEGLPPANPDQAALRAYGMRLLERLGVNHQAREYAIVSAILNIPPFDWEE